MAVASGVTVIATASSKNHEFVRMIGASAVLDYHDERITENLIEAIKEAGGNFVGAVDAIAEDATWRACAKVTKALGGGKVATFLPRLNLDGVPEGVQICQVSRICVPVIEAFQVLTLKSGSRRYFYNRQK